VVYGKGKPPVALVVDPKAVMTVLDGAKGRNTPVSLAVEGEGEPRLALVKHYQVHPWKRTLRHVDFWEVTADSVVVVPVPVTRTGEAPIEKLGGQAIFHRRHVKLRCKPGAIPAGVEIDFNRFDMDSQQLMMSEVTLPEGTELVSKGDFKVMNFKLPKAEVEETTEEEGAPASEEDQA
jgi:large subunit ribosomal protein L25